MKRSRAAGIMARAGAVPFWGPLGAVLAILLLAGPAGAQQPPAQAGGDLPVRAVRQIRAILAEKAQRTPTQRKLNSQLQDALRAPLQKPTAAGTSRLQATDPDAKNERVMVDIRADVTPTVLKRIRDLGGTVISSVPKYQAIRAQLPLRAVGRLAALDAIRTIRPARSSARFARCAHASRVCSSYSLLIIERVFRAPPFFGAFVFARRNHCSASRSCPSRPRSEIIRCAWGFSPSDPPRWTASV